MSLPESIGSLTKLEKLSLIDNQLISLPESIGKLSSLKELLLSNNPVTPLPETVKRTLKELEKRGCRITGVEI